MSFISAEPRSRVLLKSHSSSLLAQFDTQLRIVTDRYLAFFEERRSIQATYVDSLRRLYRKAKTVDASFDPGAEPTTTRAAWDTVKNNLEREANIQQAFVNTLDDDVISPLRTLKITNDEARKRIEADLEKSAASYASYTENTIAKLKQAYTKKYYPGSLGKGSAPFRGWLDPVKPEPVFDDVCRLAVGRLHDFRLEWAEDMGDGYDSLQKLTFATTVKDVLVKYVAGMTTACVKHDDLVTSTRARVEKALAGTDAPDLRASFRVALSASIPPQTIYSNHRLGNMSQLIFGVPLVDFRAKQGKVMRMCIAEVEKRGLNTHKIYSVGSVYDDKEVLELRRRVESEQSFSFRPSDNIHSVAMLLRLYLWDLPDPLFMLSLTDYRNYRRNRVGYAENDFSLLRSKIDELHPIHRALLGALLRHLLRVASHSDQSSMPVEALAAHFRYVVLRGNEVLDDGVHIKGMVLTDLIKNANTLFDEPPPNVAETMPIFNFSSFSSPEPPQSTSTQDAKPFTWNLPTYNGFSFSSSSSDPHRPHHSPNVAETTPTFSFGSFLSPESPPSALAQAGDSTTPSTRFSFSSSPSNPRTDGNSPGVSQPTPPFVFSSSLGPGFSRPEAQGSASQRASQSTGFSSPPDPHVEGSPGVAQPPPTLSFRELVRSRNPGFVQVMEQGGGTTAPSTRFSVSSTPSDRRVDGNSSSISQPTPPFVFSSSLGSGFSRPAEAQGGDSTSQRASQSTGFSFSTPPPGPRVEESPGVAKPAHTSTFHSFLSPGFPRSAEERAVEPGTTSQHPFRSTRFSFASSPSDFHLERHAPPADAAYDLHCHWL